MAFNDIEVIVCQALLNDVVFDQQIELRVLLVGRLINVKFSACSPDVFLHLVDGACLLLSQLFNGGFLSLFLLTLLECLLGLPLFDYSEVVFEAAEELVHDLVLVLLFLSLHGLEVSLELVALHAILKSLDVLLYLVVETQEPQLDLVEDAEC